MLNLKRIFTPKSYRIEQLTSAATAAKAAYAMAKFRYDDSLDRGDTRDQRKFWEPMRAARQAQLSAERALRRAEEGRA